MQLQLQINDPATTKDLTIYADNTVTAKDGHLLKLIESMFSVVTDLTEPGVNLIGRMHPTKARVFELIVMNRALDQNCPDVEIQVNSPNQQIVVHKFGEFMNAHRELMETGKDGHVIRTIMLSGFDAQAEPILRQMRDGSLILIFGFMPPTIFQTGWPSASNFMESFGNEIEKAIATPVIWDDREVFVIQNPDSTTAYKLQKFLETYWTENPPVIQPSLNLESVVPYLKAPVEEDQCGETPVQIEVRDQPILKNLGGGLLVSYVLDQADSLVYLPNRHLSDLRINAEDLHLMAVQTLAQRAAGNVKLQSYGAVHALFFDRNFEASLILLHEYWDEYLAGYVQNDFVVAVPARDMLAFCDSQSQEGIDELKNIVARVWPVGNHLISKNLYRRQKGSWLLH